MRNETTYEWQVNLVDQHGDIEDCDRCKTLQEALGRMDYYNDIELVRTVGNEDDGILDRGYAAVTGNVISERFDCGSKVPQRFVKQVAKLKT